MFLVVEMMLLEINRKIYFLVVGYIYINESSKILFNLVFINILEWCVLNEYYKFNVSVLYVYVCLYDL